MSCALLRRFPICSSAAHYDLEDYSAALHSLDESVRRDRPIAALMHRAATLLALDRRTDARRDRDAAAARGCSVQILADFDEDFEDA